VLVAEGRLTESSNLHFTHYGDAISNLLTQTVWLLSTTIYIGVSNVNFPHLIIVCQALWLPLLLVISYPYTLGLPSMLYFVSALHRNSGIAQENTFVL
jgi:hypothetical protein